jgi:hypothetical protein
MCVSARVGRRSLIVCSTYDGSSDDDTTSSSGKGTAYRCFLNTLTVLRLSKGVQEHARVIEHSNAQAFMSSQAPHSPNALNRTQHRMNNNYWTL